MAADAKTEASVLKDMGLTQEEQTTAATNSKMKKGDGKGNNAVA